MMKEIRARGPIPGNIIVPLSFNVYKSGIYSEIPLKKNSYILILTNIQPMMIEYQKSMSIIIIIVTRRKKVH